MGTNPLTHSELLLEPTPVDDCWFVFAGEQLDLPLPPVEIP